MLDVLSDVHAYVLLLVFARVLPLSLALAACTRAVVPSGVALAFTLPFVCALAPLTGVAFEPSGVGQLFLALIREVCVGGAFALALSFALGGVGLAPQFTQIRAFAGETHPHTVLYALCAGWLVLSLGGLRAVMVGLAESYLDAPLGGQVLDVGAFSFGVAQLAADAWVTALGFALPLIVAMWLVDLTVALSARVLAPPALSASAPLFLPWVYTVVAGLVLVPIVSRVPEAVRGALVAVRGLTRALAR